MPGENDLCMRCRDQRLAVVLPVELWNGNGVTRDVSASGVFFETGLTFSAGAGIVFSLLLEHADPGGPMRLHCQGKVVRVERLRGKFGVAVAINQHRFDPVELSTGSR